MSTQPITSAARNVAVPVHFSGPSFEQRLRKGKKAGKWRATWRVQMPGWDKPKRRSKGGFATKRLAEEWATRLAKANSLTEGWAMDSTGMPTAAATAGPAVSVLDDAEEFVESVGRHEWRSDNHFDRQRSVLVRAIIHLIDDPAQIPLLLTAWNAQIRSRKVRPEPTTADLPATTKRELLRQGQVREQHHPRPVHVHQLPDRLMMHPGRCRTARSQSVRTGRGECPLPQTRDAVVVGTFPPYQLGTAGPYQQALFSCACGAGTRVGLGRGHRRRSSTGRRRCGAARRWPDPAGG